MEGNDFESKLRTFTMDGARRYLVPVRTPITTRFLGFGAALLYSQASRLAKTPLEGWCDVYAVYRIHLALFERAMSQTWYAHGEDAYSFPFYNEMYEMRLKTVPTFLGVRMFFRQLGNFTHNGLCYQPYFAANRFDDGGRFVPQSEHVTLGNLRMTVEALGDPQTPLPVREAFYRCNPIPGCVWRVSDKLLLNGDEIMPQGYDLEADLELYKGMCGWVRDWKLSELFSYERPPLEPEGRPGLLMANRQGNLRIVDRDEGETLQDYYRKVQVTGDVDTFWSPHNLDDLHGLEGMLCLAGELPNLDPVYPGYVLRAENCSGWEYSSNWQGFSHLLTYL